MQFSAFPAKLIQHLSVSSSPMAKLQNSVRKLSFLSTSKNCLCTLTLLQQNLKIEALLQ